MYRGDYQLPNDDNDIVSGAFWLCLHPPIKRFDGMRVIFVSVSVCIYTSTFFCHYVEQGNKKGYKQVSCSNNLIFKKAIFIKLLPSNTLSLLHLQKCEVLKDEKMKKVSNTFNTKVNV